MKQALILLSFLVTALHSISQPPTAQLAWIRINQLGYTPGGSKVAVLGNKFPAEKGARSWELVDAASSKIVLKGKSSENFSAYGPFINTYRIDFSGYSKPGVYFLRCGQATSPQFRIDKDVYRGTADFCLRYMRQQRSGFNPYLKDSCHTHDGYTLYGQSAGIPDSTHIDVSGGWHDASDYLQYVATSANATTQLLMAYRDFPAVFEDTKAANGLDGKNGWPDVVDEAIWGLQWLEKMNPSKDQMYNQLGDDRDHISMRIPKEDTQYGRGFERPVYFVSGEKQQRGKFMNATTGTSSTAGKYATAYALAATLHQTDSLFARMGKGEHFFQKAVDAYNFALKKPGVTQTASVKSPYIYAEENWVDDMELASASLGNMLGAYNLNSGRFKEILDGATNLDGSSNRIDAYFKKAQEYAGLERVTPWMGADTAHHYQWYPFVNAGHREMSSSSVDALSKGEAYYREGIEAAWKKASGNAFHFGVPFIWCSNNLAVALATQCYWYRTMTGKNDFEKLEQATFDWLFGCNPWGTSMVYGLPANGDTPVDPHSAFTHLKNYPIDGGLVDGPVYTAIFRNLIGIQLNDADEYAEFQSDLAVYHDDYGDYSTNEPTMDGTASLIYLLAAKEAESRSEKTNRKFAIDRGGITRGDSLQKTVSLVFTADEFNEGGQKIAATLKKMNVKASFFFTGRFYDNENNASLIRRLQKDGHYLGAHSYQHLLYNDWDKRDSLLISYETFQVDLAKNYETMARFGIKKENAQYFLPPYEWYNDRVAMWTKQEGLQLINLTPGLRTAADYTWPGLPNYVTNEKIFESLASRESAAPSGLNGYIILVHLGTDPRRKEKLYDQLDRLINFLKVKRYQLQRVDELLRND